MGSVKDLMVTRPPEKGKTGIGQFRFSDRYSVFDWGEMPDHIVNKGSALCVTGAYFFEKLAEMGIKTHYIGLVEDGKTKSLSCLKNPVDFMEFRLLRVIKPKNHYDYSNYRQANANFLIPFEIIYRNSLPEGSSVFKRLKDGSLGPEVLGLNEMPESGQILNLPMLDISTKLESTDRYITWEETKNMVGLRDAELEEMKRIALIVDDLITEEVERIGLKNEDGKVEFGFDENRNLMLVDVLGTPDECRFSFNGIPVSKELARIFYRKTEWFEETEKAKKKNRAGWRGCVTVEPPYLPERFCKVISLLYQSFCNRITHKNWFDTPSLEDILKEIKEIQNAP